MMAGLAFAANYTASFVAMQFAGFTLASKQPAMTAAIANLSGSASFIQPYQWALLRTWAQFVNTSLPTPPSQLATDDFAGPAPNNTNLVVKGINGLAAFAQLLDQAGFHAEAASYRAQAGVYVQYFLAHAAAGSGDTLHYKREYQLNR